MKKLWRGLVLWASPDYRTRGEMIAWLTLEGWTVRLSDPLFDEKRRLIALGKGSRFILRSGDSISFTHIVAWPDSGDWDDLDTRSLRRMYKKAGEVAS